MTKIFLPAAALLLSALPAFAQTKPLTPPDVLSTAKTIQFTAILLIDNKPVESSTAILAAPNKAYVFDTNLRTKTVEFVYASDGKTQIEYRASHHRYTRSDAPKHIGSIDSVTIALTVLVDFYDKIRFAKFRHIKPGSPLYVRSYNLDGRTMIETLAVVPQTGLPDVAIIGVMPDPKAAEYIEFSHWKLNAPIDDSKFAYTPPADAELYTVPGGGLDVN